MKTESQVEQDFYDALQWTSLIKFVNGGLYKHGLRPFDSKKEDVIVKVTTLTAAQRQDGVVTVIAYCPNIDGAEFGRLTPNKKRLSALEYKMYEMFAELKVFLEHYDNIRLDSAIGSRYDNELKQSFTYCKIKFAYYN